MNLIKALKNPQVYFLIAKNKTTNFFRRAFYKGNQVICEICNWNGKKFFDGKCPNCNSLPRTRLIPFSIRYFSLKNINPKILHIAPNKNEYHFIKNNITELSSYDRLNIRPVKHINIIQDLTATNLESNIYDLAIAWHVLEHIPEDIKAITEVYRLLKTNGKFLISVPIHPKGNLETYEDQSIEYKDFEKTHGHYDHCRSCGLDYYKRFETIGFKTQTLCIKNSGLNKINLFGLSGDHVVWCFTK